MRRHTVEVRSAHVSHVPAIAELMNRFSGKGDVLPRSMENIYQSVREWVVALDGETIVGCGSLVVLWADLAEIRSLIVAPEYQGEGIGRKMVDMLIDQAVSLDIPKVFALTRKHEFFVSTGFHQVPRASLPRKIWKDCIHCTHFVGCDEVAMLQEVQLQSHPSQQDTMPILVDLAVA